MEQLDTPTGSYDLDSLKKFSYAIRRALGLPSLDYEDLYHDIILYLLEGKTLPTACLITNKKYQSWTKQVSIERMPEIGCCFPQTNERVLTDVEKQAYRNKFYMKVERLKVEDQMVIMLRILGLTHKEISNTLGLDHATVRKRFERVVKRMKHGDK